jgi:hypothetical protein
MEPNADSSGPKSLLKDICCAVLKGWARNISTAIAIEGSFDRAKNLGADRAHRSTPDTSAANNGCRGVKERFTAQTYRGLGIR